MSLERKSTLDPIPVVHAIGVVCSAKDAATEYNNPDGKTMFAKRDKRFEGIWGRIKCRKIVIREPVLLESIDVSEVASA